MVKTTPTLSIAQKLSSETVRFEEKQTIMSELYEVCRKVARVFRKKQGYKSFWDCSFDEDDFEEEVFLRALKDIDTFEDDKNALTTYVYRICSFVQCELIRKNYNRHKIVEMVPCEGIDENGKTYSIIDEYVHASSIEEELFQDNHNDFPKGFLDKLLPNRRDVFMHCEILGEKPSEYAKKCGLNVKKVYNDLARARNDIASIAATMDRDELYEELAM